MKRWKWMILALAFLALVVAVRLDPSARVEGWLKDEPFFAGRSASAWTRDLTQPESNDRTHATEALADGGVDAVPVLTAIIRHSKDSEARWRAIDAIGRIGPNAKDAGPDVVEALADPDPLVSKVAAQTLEKLAPTVPEAPAALVAAFPRIEAIRAIARYGNAATLAVAPLTELTQHEDPVVRWNAIRALGKLGPLGLPALEQIIAATEDPNMEVREHAAEAIGDIGPSAAKGIPALVKTLGDSNARVRRDAVRALGHIGPAAKDVLPQVQALKKDPDPSVRAAATDAERKIDPSLTGQPKPNDPKAEEPKKTP